MKKLSFLGESIDGGFPGRYLVLKNGQHIDKTQFSAGRFGMLQQTDIQFMGFIYATLDQMVNHASRLRTRTRGRLTCPMVLRAPYGGGIRAPEHHSESTEALFAHVPGLRVVISQVAKVFSAA